VSLEILACRQSRGLLPAAVCGLVHGHRSRAPRRAAQAVKVFLNGRWIGITNQVMELKENLLTFRRTGAIGEDVSVVYDHALSELRVGNDFGRICRPLYIVQDRALNLAKEHILGLRVRLPSGPPPLTPSSHLL
jgi:DNA-directed RNA polymerase beta subunit